MIRRPMRRTIAVVLLSALAVSTAGTAAVGARRAAPSRRDPSIESRYLEQVRRAETKTRAPDVRLAKSTGSPTLHYGSPAAAGLVDEHLTALDDAVIEGLQPAPTNPHYPGAVALAARNAVIAWHEPYGYAYKYADSTPTLLPEDQWIEMQEDTIFDLASVSKLFTSIAVMQQIERGVIDLNAPVADYIPAFAQNGKSEVTIEQLLTHTSGLPAWLPLYSEYETPEERIAAIYEVAPENPPGSTYVYSDLGMITLGKVVEATSGTPLDVFMETNILQPLGLNDTGFNPPPEDLDRIAATEYQPWTGRGMVRGSVHDENAWSLGGVAGHAGVFGTARDLAVLAQTILNGGSYGRVRILEPASVEAMLTNFNTEFPGSDHGLGFELYQHWYMDAMATPITAGHTGFTGTSMVLNPIDKSFVILLTNRVHPSRDWGSINPYRRAAARAVGRAVPVRPADGNRAWFSNLGDDLQHTLDLTTTLPEGAKELQLHTWFDTEPGFDWGSVSLSGDGGATWTNLQGTLSRAGESVVSNGVLTGWSGRAWWDGTFDLSAFAGDVILRFGYNTDGLYSGRGVYVDGIRIESEDGVLFDDSRPRDRARLVPSGWSESRN